MLRIIFETFADFPGISQKSVDYRDSWNDDEIVKLFIKNKPSEIHQSIMPGDTLEVIAISGTRPKSGRAPSASEARRRTSTGFDLVQTSATEHEVKKSSLKSISHHLDESLSKLHLSDSTHI